MIGDDRLSAYLDGELDPADVDGLRAEIEADSALSTELEAIRRSRGLVAGLGPVEPPADFVFAPAADDYHADDADNDATVVSLDERRRARPWLLGIAAATIFVLVLGFASGTPVADVVPPVDALVDQHAAAAEAMPDGMVTGSFEVMPMDEMDDMGPAMPDMPMVAVYQSGEITQFLYDSAHGPVSVFRQDGSLDDTGLTDAVAMPMESGTAQVMTTDDGDVVIVERDDVVFTVVGAADNHDMVMATADSVPATDRGLLDSIRRWFGRRA
ncbi:MAG: anti-sigma factor family protein [Acidimicrobiales bacterium]